MISALFSRLVILIFGTLYPAYGSYKAVKTKDLKLYVKWMMYWIVFALFTAVETFTDIFVGFWCPFYYECKIILVIWLLSPATRGSSYLYRTVIHPLFVRKEQEIDEMIAKAKDQGYNVLLDIGCKGMTLATNAIMNTAVKGGSGLLFQLRKSYSLNDLVTNDATDGSNDRRRKTWRKEDCKKNFQDDDVNESKMISADSQTDIHMMEEDSNIFFNECTPRNRELSSESMALENDCRNVSSNLRPRRNTRQEAEKMELISTNSSFPYNPIFPQNYPIAPFLYYSSLAKTNYLMAPGTLNDSDICENFLKMKISTVESPSYDMKKSNSTPDVSVIDSKWTLSNSTSPIQPKKKPRRKKTAPKPPVPLISIDTPTPAPNEPMYSFNADYLAPNLKRRPRKSKIHQFLSKSRELLSNWKADDGRSEMIDGSSDDSISTTSSYNTVN